MTRRGYCVTLTRDEKTTGLLLGILVFGKQEADLGFGERFRKAAEFVGESDGAVLQQLKARIEAQAAQGIFHFLTVVLRVEDQRLNVKNADLVFSEQTVEEGFVCDFAGQGFSQGNGVEDKAESVPVIISKGFAG